MKIGLQTNQMSQLKYTDMGQLNVRFLLMEHCQLNKYIKTLNEVCSKSSKVYF